jgi:hypothetical protein
VKGKRESFAALEKRLCSLYETREKLVIQKLDTKSVDKEIEQLQKKMMKTYKDFKN